MPAGSTALRSPAVAGRRRERAAPTRERPGCRPASAARPPAAPARAGASGPATREAAARQPAARAPPATPAPRAAAAQPVPPAPRARPAPPAAAAPPAPQAPRAPPAPSAAAAPPAPPAPPARRATGRGGTTGSAGTTGAAGATGRGGTTGSAGTTGTAGGTGTVLYLRGFRERDRRRDGRRGLVARRAAAAATGRSRPTERRSCSRTTRPARRSASRRSRAPAPSGAPWSGATQRLGAREAAHVRQQRPGGAALRPLQRHQQPLLRGAGAERRADPDLGRRLDGRQRRLHRHRDDRDVLRSANQRRRVEHADRVSWAERSGGRTCPAR